MTEVVTEPVGSSPASPRRSAGTESQLPGADAGGRRPRKSRAEDRGHRIEIIHDDRQLSEAAALFRTAMIGLPAGAVIDEGLHEPGRTLGLFDGGALVATANSYTSRLVVPGGSWVPHAAVTHVGVHPSHTRRGHLTALVRRQLSDIAARGEIVATLRASQGSIYERFGYGIATHSIQQRLALRMARLRPTVPVGGEVRLIEPATSRELLARISRGGGSLWTGAIDRLGYWWRSVGLEDGAVPQYVAVHGPAGAEDGFVRYHPLHTDEWFLSRDRTVLVSDLFAATDEARGGLVRHLLSLDLVDVAVISNAPIDDPLTSLFVDERVVSVEARRDETWLRIVDVPAALAARRFRGSGSVVVHVTDDQLPANQGRYRISSVGLERTSDVGDLELDVSALAAVYLGGSRWWQLRASGRVVEHRAGALEIAEELFSTDRAPYSGVLF
jgi:predicted acetyltransferase